MQATSAGIISDSVMWTMVWPFIKSVATPGLLVGILVIVVKTAFRLGSLSTQFNSVVKDMKTLKNDSKSVTKDVDVIRTFLVSKQGMDAGLFAAHSPVVLLQKGIDLLKRSGFESIFKKNKDWFVEGVKEYGVSSLGEIDESCQKFIERNKDDAKFAKFREISFQNGVAVDVLFRVCSIYLRDKIAKILGISS